MPDWKRTSSILDVAVFFGCIAIGLALSTLASVSILLLMEIPAVRIIIAVGAWCVLNCATVPLILDVVYKRRDRKEGPL